MTSSLTLAQASAVLALFIGAMAPPDAGAATAAHTARAKPARHAASKPPPGPPPAPAEQLDAAKLVYLGHYHCEQDKSVDIAPDDKYAGYVDVKSGKTTYLMKPVLSSTGAVRLEDVKGRTLMVQIAQKSMLLDVKAGHRIVDDCVSPRQDELAAEAKQAEAAQAAASAAAAAASAASAATAAAVSAAQAASQAAAATTAAASAAAR
ncbi:MAG TPA: hypothetical protein VJ743_21920 [Albitalea sp.]|nr:hypothetical protein [Albitalea sp.]